MKEVYGAWELEVPTLAVAVKNASMLQATTSRRVVKRHYTP